MTLLDTIYQLIGFMIFVITFGNIVAAIVNAEYKNVGPSIWNIATAVWGGLIFILYLIVRSHTV